MYYCMLFGHSVAHLFIFLNVFREMAWSSRRLLCYPSPPSVVGFISIVFYKNIFYVYLWMHPQRKTQNIFLNFHLNLKWKKKCTYIHTYVWSLFIRLHFPMKIHHVWVFFVYTINIWESNNIYFSIGNI